MKKAAAKAGRDKKDAKKPVNDAQASKKALLDDSEDSDGGLKVNENYAKRFQVCFAIYPALELAATLTAAASAACAGSVLPTQPVAFWAALSRSNGTGAWR